MLETVLPAVVRITKPVPLRELALRVPISWSTGEIATRRKDIVRDP